MSGWAGATNGEPLRGFDPLEFFVCDGMSATFSALEPSIPW
jgi:hypothetical protein